MNTHTTTLATRSTKHITRSKVLPPELNEIRIEKPGNPLLKVDNEWLSYQLQPQWLGSILRVYCDNQLVWAVRLGSTSGSLMLPSLSGTMHAELEKDHLKFTQEL